MVSKIHDTIYSIEFHFTKLFSAPSSLRCKIYLPLFCNNELLFSTGYCDKPQLGHFHMSTMDLIQNIVFFFHTQGVHWVRSTVQKLYFWSVFGTEITAMCVWSGASLEIITLHCHFRAQTPNKSSSEAEQLQTTSHKLSPHHHHQDVLPYDPLGQSLVSRWLFDYMPETRRLGVEGSRTRSLF